MLPAHHPLTSRHYIQHQPTMETKYDCEMMTLEMLVVLMLILMLMLMMLLLER